MKAAKHVIRKKGEKNEFVDTPDSKAPSTNSTVAKEEFNFAISLKPSKTLAEYYFDPTQLPEDTRILLYLCATKKTHHLKDFLAAFIALVWTTINEYKAIPHLIDTSYLQRHTRLVDDLVDAQHKNIPITDTYIDATKKKIEKELTEFSAEWSQKINAEFAGINFTTESWKDLIEQPEYAEARIKLITLYENNSKYKNAIDQTVKDRISNRYHGAPIDIFLTEHIKEYVLEEGAEFLVRVSKPDNHLLHETGLNQLLDQIIRDHNIKISAENEQFKFAISEIKQKKNTVTIDPAIERLQKALVATVNKDMRSVIENLEELEKTNYGDLEEFRKLAQQLNIINNRVLALTNKSKPKVKKSLKYNPTHFKRAPTEEATELSSNNTSSTFILNPPPSHSKQYRI